MLTGVQEANIIHMLEMVVLAYLLGWIQALVGSDFDEVDRLCEGLAGCPCELGGIHRGVVCVRLA